MSMIDRYRKKGGFVQLLNLIETTGRDKQEKFLKIIGEEGPAWEAEIRKRLLTVDKIINWNPQYLAEIFPRMQPLQLAMIVGGLPPDKAEQMMKVMTFKEKKQIEDLLKEKTPAPGETSAAIMKLYSEIRKMEAEGSLRFEKFDPEMVIPENIEDMLGKGTNVFAMPTASASMSTASMESAMAASSASTAGVPTNVAEELSALRRKLVQLTQENQRLHQENTTLKDKLEQIKKIA